MVARKKHSLGLILGLGLAQVMLWIFVYWVQVISLFGALHDRAEPYGIPLLASALALLLIYPASLVVVYQDAEARGKEGVLWLLVTAITGGLGTIVWALIRPKAE